MEDRMLRKMRDISTLNKKKGEDREEDEEEEEVEQPRQDRKGRVGMIPISLTTHAQDYCCCLPATSASTVERHYTLIHRSFVRRSRK